MAAIPQPTTILAENTTTPDVFWDAGRPIVDPSDLAAILGWELKPEGLCQGDSCVPIPDWSSLEHPAGIDLTAVADTLGRPVVVDPDARMVAVGIPSSERHRAPLNRQAPDVRLLDLQGAQRGLSEWSGTRRLLVAFSTW